MLAVTFLFGLYAIYYGRSEIETQRDIIKAIQELEHKEFSSYKSSFKEEMESLEQERTHDMASRPASAWFRHGYHAILPPHDYAALSIGQRDLFRYYYRLTGMSLHYQLFENELANPVNLMAGNFDLSFVLVYLFPLLIIAFCYGLFSSDKENGTLALLQIQSISIRKIILVKLIFYFVLITGLALLISLIGLLTAGNPLKAENKLPTLTWLTGVVVYCAFWFFFLFLIVSFRKSSSFNAITAAGCWLILLIVIPAILNVLVSTKYPLNSATLASLTRRTGLENEDDEEESREVIAEFFAHKPELAASDSLIQNSLMTKTYAAFSALKDIKSQKQVDHYNAQVKNRDSWTSNFHWLSPAVNMQETFAHITQTDLNTFLQFQDALANFHGDITGFYFNRLFWDKLIVLEDYQQLPVFHMSISENRWPTVWGSLGKIGLTAILVFLFGFVNMKKVN
ncbi:MAG: ABC-2 type transport system permease protein [Roseivirga sp.]|jgi:ABC-2 type transport system permease protein